MFRLVALALVVAAVAIDINDKGWAKFKKQYKKTYTDDVDELTRYKLYQATLERVAKLNVLNGQPAFGITWMADRYESEKYKRGHKKPAGFVPRRRSRTSSPRRATPRASTGALPRR